MFWRLVSGSLRHQWARLGIAALAMALGSTLVSGLLNLSGDIGEQVGRELRSYGANVLIRPQQASLPVGAGSLAFGSVTARETIAQVDLETARDVEGVIGIVPYLYVVVQVRERSAILAGVEPAAAQSLNSWWKVEGHWPQAEDELLVGARATRALGLAVGDTLTVGYGDRNKVMRVVGVVETGGGEDEQLIAYLHAVQNLTLQPGQVALAMVSALASDRSLKAIVRDLQAQVAGAEVRTLEQFARAETTVLDKVRLLIGLVAALVLIAGTVTIASTLNTIVVERRTEIGLMKALGAADRHVAGLFLVEALSIGAAGGVAGYVAGLALAIEIGRRVFEAAILVAPQALPATLVIALAVSLLAGLLPVRRAMAVDPANTLRGE